MADCDNIIRLAELQDSGKDINTTEDGMALVFAERHAGHLRYVAAWSRWLSYDGTCWRYDDTLHVFERARVICREVAAACVRPAGAIMSAKTVAAVEKLARSDRRLAARAAQWEMLHRGSLTPPTPPLICTPATAAPPTLSII
jgi:phage/plasmid-associated DNA primase